VLEDGTKLVLYLDSLLDSCPDHVVRVLTKVSKYLSPATAVLHEPVTVK
jgi:hypothetical protein